MNKLQLYNDLAESRKQVTAFEELSKTIEQVELIVEHLFAEGIYARRLFIPQKVILTGKIHKYSQLNILLEGVIDVLIYDTVQRVKAPFVMVSPPGTKRIMRAVEDCVWLTVHGTHETDVDEIEDRFIAQTEEEFLEHIQNEPLLPGF